MKTDSGLGERLRRAREGAGLSQSVAAGAVMSVPHLSMAERGRRGLSARTLVKLAERLPVSFQELLPQQLEPDDAEELLAAAEHLYRGGQDSRAAAILQAMIEVLPPRRDDLRAKCLVAIGGVWTWLQQFDLAERSLREGLHLAERIGDPELIGDAYLKLGAFHLRQSQFHEGLTALEGARVALSMQRRPKPSGLGRVLLNIGHAHIMLGNSWDALDVLAEAADVAERAGEDALVGDIARNGASAWMALHRYDEALAQLRIARDRYLKAERLDRLANVENGLGLLFLKTGRPAEAIEPLQRSVSLAERVGDVRLQAQSLTELARAHIRLRHYDAAYPIAVDAIRLSMRANDDVEAARAEALRAEVLAHRGQVAEAEAGVRFAISIFERREQREDLVQALQVLGMVHERQGQHAYATEIYQRALALARGEE